MAATNIYDAIIVGSGITGGWAAKELTEKGLNVLVLEAGRTIIPEKDYVEHVPVWELKYRGWDNRAERAGTQPTSRERNFRGFAGGRWAESRLRGGGRVIDGAIWILRRT